MTGILYQLTVNPKLYSKMLKVTLELKDKLTFQSSNTLKHNSELVRAVGLRLGDSIWLCSDAMLSMLRW